MNRFMLHCDMNNYFATVEEKYNPDLRKVPFAVIGDPEMRHSIVMAKNSLAKKAGVITGISYTQAKQICPALGYVKADLPKYLKETKLAREIYMKHTDTIIPYGLDESWVDLTDYAETLDEAKQIAELIRLDIMYSLDLSASIGVSDNKIFAKLGSDLTPPNTVAVITHDNYKQVAWPLPASDLLFVGVQRKKVLAGAGINTIGDIAAAKPEVLIKLLGKVGYDVWCFSNGDDSSFNPENEKIGSIGNTLTPPEDMRNASEVSAIIFLIVNSICARLKKHGLKASCVSITLKDNQFNSFIRQSKTNSPTDGINTIFNAAHRLFTKHYKWDNPLRSLGVRVTGLINTDYRQLSLFEENDEKLCIDIDSRLKTIMAKFSKLSFEQTAMSGEYNESL